MGYTCEQIQSWLSSDEPTNLGITNETKDYLRIKWWQPKCCRVEGEASLTLDPTSTVKTTPPTDAPTDAPIDAPTGAPKEDDDKEKEDGQEDREPVTTCYDYTKVVDLGKDCNWWYLFHQIRDEFMIQREFEGAPRCGLTSELRLLTETTGDEWKSGLQMLCDKALYNDAMDEVETVDWNRIVDADVNLEDYFNGDGFLNNDYGNLQQQESEFERRGGYDRYHYIGTDPTKNDYLPTPQRSVDGGEAINRLYTEDAITKVLTAPSFSKLEGGCPETNAAMCCWSRDRQYNDNNGNCNSNGHCRNGDPGDNTDLCWTKGEGDSVFPYPTSGTRNDGLEGALHCHGYSWSDNDI